VLSSSDLSRLYDLILSEYVDQVDPRVVINGAIAGFHAGAVSSGLLPMDSALVDTVPLQAAGDTDVAWSRLARAYAAFATKLGTRLNVADIGQATARGMLDALDDPQTTYLDRKTVQAQQTGGYVGIGITVTTPQAKGPPVVREVVPDSPAERAGIRAGDSLLRIDGDSAETMSVGDAVQRIRGTEGSRIALSVLSPDARASRDVVVTRTALRLPFVTFDARDGIDIVRIRSFQDGVADTVRSRLRESVTQGSSGWMLDLRGNTGGSLREVASVAGIFVGNDPIGVVVNRAQRRVGFNAVGPALASRPPTAVLVDGDTRSGAEVLVAALQEEGVATIVGSRTAGRVGIASSVDLPDGSVVQITTERILTPSGASLNRVGVQPDRTVGSTVEDWARGLDPQLDAALAEIAQPAPGSGVPETFPQNPPGGES
jgi:carboxyl-terminal processing protease